MNILVVGQPYLDDSLNASGCNVVNANFPQTSDLPLTHPHTWKNLDAKLKSGGFAPDLVFYADNGNMPLILDPENIPVLSIFYSIDTYCNPWHVPYAHAFDSVLVAQKDFMPVFADDGQNPVWFPPFCNAATPGPAQARDIPVSFVGTLGHKNNPDREPFLRKFDSLLPLKLLSGDFKPIFSRSLITLNQTAFGEINFRCFDAMGLGAALLMEKCGNGFAELFTPGIDILPPFTRNDAGEAARIASIFLKRPKALARIAERGQELVLKYHSDKARARALLEHNKRLTTENAGQKRQANRREFGAYSRTALAMLGSELTEEKWSGYREFFLSMAQRP